MFFSIFIHQILAVLVPFRNGLYPTYVPDLFLLVFLAVGTSCLHWKEKDA